MTATPVEKITETPFTVEGMRCSSCVAKVEKTLLDLPDIISASVNLANGRTVITHRKTFENFDIVKQAIAKLGYKAILKDDVKSIQSSNSLELIRLGVSVLCTAPLLLMMLAGHHIIPLWLQFMMAAVVQIVGASGMYPSAFKSLRHLAPNMDVLVVIGSLSAFGLSTYNWLNGIEGVYFESAAGIITFVMIGKYLESNARKKVAKLFERLDSEFPEYAVLFVDGREKRVPIEELKEEMICSVKAGEKIPADAIITSGEAEIDESSISGEQMPKLRKVGDAVCGGTINLNGTLLVKTVAEPSSSLLQKIADTVSDATSGKPEVQKLVDQISFYFVPAAIALSILTTVIWIAAGAEPSVAIITGISVLVVSCPCALGIATPLALTIGLSVAARRGIIFRNLQAMENCADIKTIAFDKTGTLTSGTPMVANMAVFSFERDETIRMASSLAIHSNHPISRSILNYAKDQNLSTYAIKYFQERAGLGLSGKIKERDYILGSTKLMNEYKIPTSEIMDEFHSADNPEASESIVFFAETHPTKKLIATFVIKDNIRDSARLAIKLLKAARVESVMLTGDLATTARKIARKVGIKRVISEVMPMEKWEVIKELKESSSKVGMVGDGINDAIAIAEADVGFAMSDISSNLSVSGSSVILLRPELNLIPSAIVISRLTRRKITQNLTWAFGYNAIAIPAAALGLLSPVVSSIAMSVSSLAVVINSLTIYYSKSK